jgi:hypothetical protein
MATKPKTKAETVPPSVKDLDPTDPKLTKAIVERLRYLKERRKRLEAEAREFATEEDQLVDVVMAWMENKGVHACKMHGYQIMQVEGRAFPKVEGCLHRFGRASQGDQVRSRPHLVPSRFRSNP